MLQLNLEASDSKHPEADAQIVFYSGKNLTEADLRVLPKYHIKGLESLIFGSGGDMGRCTSVFNK